MNRLWLLVFNIVICRSVPVLGDDKAVVCIFDMQATERTGDARFTVDDINPNLCTHMVAVTSLGNSFDFINSSQYRDFVVQMKKKNPLVKVLMSLNSDLDSLNSVDEEQMTNATYLLDKTTQDVLALVQDRQVDGVILRSPPKQYSTLNYNKIIQSLKNAFQPHGYLLAIYGDSNFYGRVPFDYDIPFLRRTVDFLLLETDNYLLYGSKELKLADNLAPLYRQPWHDKNQTNVHYEVSHWINSGFPANKIVINIPLYGKSWQLSSDQTTPPAPAVGKAPAQFILWSDSESSGYMTYLEICLAVSKLNWSVFQDQNRTMGSYAVSPKDPENKNATYWVGYDDVDMAVAKSQYALSKNLAGVYLGVVFFDISYDDFHNKCGKGRYPMLTAVRKTLTPGWTSSSTTVAFNYCLFVVVLLFSVVL